MIIHAKTDVGKVRATNQDAYFAGELEAGAVYAVVCDGMGGANAGNVASEAAVKLISEYVLHSYVPKMDSMAVERMLKSAIENANAEIFEMSQNSKELEGMGTTAVVVFVKGNEVVIAHVGDSRAYLAGDEFIQLTRDHSVVQTLVESGKISPEDAKTHPDKNVITRAIGAEAAVVVDIDTLSVKQGETLLLCTDGLTGYAERDEIFRVLKEEIGNNTADKLIELANAGGGGDNITVVTLTTDC